MISYSQTIEFTNVFFDFGKIENSGDTLIAKFSFKNKGTQKLELLSVKNSCKFIRVSYPNILNPNETDFVIVKYYNPDPGFINKIIIVNTNDPQQPVVILRIKGETYKKQQ
jgi:hypothetical protein